MSSNIILNKLYDNLKTNLVLDNKLKKKSILISFIELKSNSRYRYIIDSAQELNQYNKSDINELINNKLIRETENINNYAITGKGIWSIEGDSLISIEGFIEYIDNKYFDIAISNEKITDKEKVILFSLITARSFSEASAISLKNDSLVLDSCKRIIDNSYLILYEFKIIKEINNLFGKKGNEHIVSHLIRHTDALPKKTKGIYKASGNQNYFLEIVENDDIINIDKLCYIIQCIVSSNTYIKFNDILSIFENCKIISYNEAAYLNTNLNKSFINPYYDDIIKNAFEEVILRL